MTAPRQRSDGFSITSLSQVMPLACRVQWSRVSRSHRWHSQTKSGAWPAQHSDLRKGALKKICTNSHKKKERGEEAPMPRTVRGLPQTERHFCRCYACGWSCWFGASDWTCWSKPVRAICGGSCCLLDACSRHLDSWIFSFDFEFQLTLARRSSFMLAHG